MGGAMDLVSGCRNLCVIMEHTSKGKPKILKQCSLPLTGKGVVNMIVTDMAMFKFWDGKLILEEIADDTTVDEVRSSTEASFVVADKIGIF